MTLVIASMVVLVSLSILLMVKNNQRLLGVHLVLLLLSPWWLTLLIARPSLRSLPSTQPKLDQIGDNVSFFTSAEFLFFSGDGRPGYGTGEHGVFLLSFLPLIAVGFWQSLREKSNVTKLPLWWLGGGVTAAATLSNVPGLPGSVWFLPAMSVLATIGLNVVARSLKDEKKTSLHKTMAIILLVWLLYEALRLYQIILIHKPFNL